MKFLSQDKLHVNDKCAKIQAQNLHKKTHNLPTCVIVKSNLRACWKCSCLEAWIISLWYEIVHIKQYPNRNVSQKIKNIQI